MEIVLEIGIIMSSQIYLYNTLLTVFKTIKFYVLFCVVLFTSLFISYVKELQALNNF